MKELSIEEKAKSYDEALKKAKQFHNKDLFAECNGNLVEYIFESEDEKVRKALIRFHKSTIDVDGIKGEDIIDWLEKQGETFTKKDVDDAYLKGICFPFNEVKKCNIQYLPAWSLNALLDLMPNVNGHYPELCRGKQTGQYYMWIEDIFDTQTFNNPIDAAFEMICWLKENRKI